MESKIEINDNKLKLAEAAKEWFLICLQLIEYKNKKPTSVKNKKNEKRDE